ncbi:MAG: hypothetical protein EBY65_06295, partial [Acidimicrobiia bacterium]|nr:hypothetical protein [Acidimicrobiia bacterium]
KLFRLRCVERASDPEVRRRKRRHERPLQFEVVQHRLENEFGAPVELVPCAWSTARITDQESAEALRGMSGVTVAARSDGELLALFESPYWLQRLEMDQPELTLTKLIAEGS